MNNLKVQKREGGEEDWNQDKIIASITKAGGKLEDAQMVANGVRQWATDASQNGAVRSTQIRDKVIESLRSTDPVVASTYEGYKK